MTCTYGDALSLYIGYRIATGQYRIIDDRGHEYNVTGCRYYPDGDRVS